MDKLKIFISFSFLLVAFSLSGQNVDKIDKKLEKIFQSGNYEKLEIKAKKLKKKFPRIDSPNYYLSKLEIDKYHKVSDLPNKKQYNYLRKATAYSKKLGKEYGFWQDSLKTYYKLYINSWSDNDYCSSHIKSVVGAYDKAFKEELPSYRYYFGNVSSVKPISGYDIPETSDARTALISYASKLVGIKYVYGGEKPEDGFDCSGFVKYVYKSVGVELPHNAHMISQIEGEIITLEEAQPGDLIFFGTGNSKKWKTQHAGIIYEYDADEPKVIHCVSRGVTIDGNNSSWDSYWKERILFVKRIPQLED